MSTDLVPIKKEPPHFSYLGKTTLAYDNFCPNCGFTLWNAFYGSSSDTDVIAMLTGYVCVICGDGLIKIA